MATPLSYLGLPSEETGYEKSDIVVIPCPYEKTTSFMKGTKEGPRAILQSSYQVEFYDPELKEETWKPGIHTLKPLDFANDEPQTALAKIENEVAKVLENKKFPICLGGEHTITAGPVAACTARYPNVSILQIDAHADLREVYEGTPYSHACAMRQSLKFAKKSVGVGIRSVATEEVEFAKNHPEITLIYDHERRVKKEWIEEALAGLDREIYLTIDVDGFDPSLIPATGTPEPGGLSWSEGLDLIRACFQHKRVVGADVVELLPQAGFHASNFIAAKLVYKLIGYYHRFQRR